MSQPVHIAVATRASRIAAVVFGALAIVLAAAPLFGDRQLLHLLAEIYAYLCLATLWNLLAGYAGLVSVGQQAYVGLGGYALFALAIRLHVPPLWAIPLAGAIGALVALPAAALLFRLRGAYFAIGSWVLAEIFRLLAAQISALGGGSGSSLPAAIVIGIAASRQAREDTFYWCAFALLLVVFGCSYGLLRSRLGLALRAVGDNEVAARSNGVSVTGLKLAVYVGVAGLTAMTGAMIFFATPAHLARRRLQRQRLDRLRHLHGRHRWHRQPRRPRDRHTSVLRLAPMARRLRRALPDAARPHRRRHHGQGPARSLRAVRDAVRREPGAREDAGGEGLAGC